MPFVIWTNTFCNLNKYILPFEQIHFAIWTNTFGNLDKNIILDNTAQSNQPNSIALDRASDSIAAHLPTVIQKSVSKSIASRILKKLNFRFKKIWNNFNKLCISQSFAEFTFNKVCTSTSFLENFFEHFCCKNLENPLLEKPGKSTAGQNLLRPRFLGPGLLPGWLPACRLVAESPIWKTMQPLPPAPQTDADG